MPENSAPLPDFTRWPSFPFEGDMRVKRLAPAVDVEPPRSGEDPGDCVACNTPDDAYIWVSERWRVRAMDRPSGLPMVLILECRSHLDLGDLPNLLAAELGVMTVRMERAIRSLDGVARVHVNRWGDGSAHLHMWFLARPYGRLQLRGTFLSLWDDILPVIPEHQWRENLALVAAWLAEFGGQAIAEPAHIQWQSPSTINVDLTSGDSTELGVSTSDKPADPGTPSWRPSSLSDVEGPTDGIRPSNGRKPPTASGSASVAAVRAAASAGSTTAAGPPTGTESQAVPTGDAPRKPTIPRPSPAGDDLLSSEAGRRDAETAGRSAEGTGSAAGPTERDTDDAGQAHHPDGDPGGAGNAGRDAEDTNDLSSMR